MSAGMKARSGPVADATGPAQDDGPESAGAIEARALRALSVSGRVLARRRGGAWGVLNGRDRRGRPIVTLPEETVERLACEGVLRMLDAHAYALALGPGAAPVVAPPPRRVFVAADARRPGRRSGGIGFAGLAMLAQQGRGPLDMRQVQAGLRLGRDAERASADARLTMNWDAGPVTPQRRAGKRGGLAGEARHVARFLDRLRARLGDATWRLLWALCVDAETLRAIKKRFCISQGDLHAGVAQALERLAEAYDRSG